MTQRAESIAARLKKEENGADATSFAKECGAEFQQVVFQNMDICNGVCRIVRYHLPKNKLPKPAKYDSFLVTHEYEDGGFHAFVEVQGKSWQDKVRAAQRGAAAAQPLQ